ncbi:MAG: hypothetical protein Q8878_08765 [Bacillota bacterium]|nr:hypothetical protein [Bacillota bacterium]
MRYTRENYIKWAAYGMLLLVLFLIETAYRFKLTVLGVRPDIIPFFIAALALYEGPGCAAVIGFISGLLCDFVQPGLDGFLPLFYTAAGLGIGFVSEKYFRKNIFSALLLGASASVLLNLLRFIFYYALLFNASVLTGVKITFSELLLSLLFSPVVYYGVRLINRHFDDEEE